MTQYLGRHYKEDNRDYLLRYSSEYHFATPTEKYKYWWASAWWGNQGRTPQCVAYSWLHWLEDGPVTHFYENRNFDPVYLNPEKDKKHQPLFSPETIYNQAQQRDAFPGTDYDGTTVRAGAKVLKDLGVIKEYRWASNTVQIVNTILSLGPMVVGTPWYEQMFYPSKEGIIKPEGRQVGGHAYVLNGVNTEKGLFRIKNSWGRGWSRRGYAYISIEDFDKLLNDYGEAVIAIGKRKVKYND